MEITLVVVGGKANKNQIKLALPAVIGRSRHATLTIGHPKVSRQHCELIEQAGAVVVRDSGSLNGTLVNGHVVKECPVQPGEKLTVGPLTFMLMYEPAAETVQPEVTLSVNSEPSAPAGDVLPADAFQETAASTDRPAAGSEEDGGTVELPAAAAVADSPAPPSQGAPADDLLPPSADDERPTEHPLDLPPSPKPSAAETVVADTLATGLAAPKVVPPAPPQTPPAAAPDDEALQEFLRKFQ
jgi:predicted component of type VI protein secretion system